MQDSPSALMLFERCRLASYFSRDWQRLKYDEVEMIQESLRDGFLTKRQDHGQCAGERCYAIGSSSGLQSDQHNVYDQVVHLATLTDILATAVRKKGEPPWLIPDLIELGSGAAWTSAAFLSPDGTRLRRVALVSNWSDDRHYSEARSWRTLGEVCVYGLPMQQVVCVIGQSRSGKRHSWWTHGLRHPVNKVLRFRKRNQVESGFKSTWKEVWREDYDDLTTDDWLRAMLEDDVLKDCCFKVDVPVPEKVSRQRILDLAARKLEAIQNLDKKPDQNLSTCDWPIPCTFRSPCHKNDTPSGRYGFVRITSQNDSSNDPSDMG